MGLGAVAPLTLQLQHTAQHSTAHGLAECSRYIGHWLKGLGHQEIMNASSQLTETPNLCCYHNVRYLCT
jgi:hypothetical protein